MREHPRSSSSNHSTSLTSEKSEGKYPGGNRLCVQPTPKWQKAIGSPSSSNVEKENHVPSDDEEEAGGSGIGKAPKKSCPLVDDVSDED